MFNNCIDVDTTPSNLQLLVSLFFILLTCGYIFFSSLLYLFRVGYSFSFFLMKPMFNCEYSPRIYEDP